MSLPFDLGSFVPIVPALVLLAFGVVTLIFGVFADDRSAQGPLALTGVAAAAVFAVHQLMQSLADGAPSAAFGGSFLGDGLGSVFSLIILLGTGLTVWLAGDHLGRLQLDHPEFYPLLLFAATGAIVMVSAGDLITLLLGLEIMSLPVYALAAWREGSRSSEEAGMKYFLLGAFASAILIYGIALLYGATGRFDFPGVAAALQADASGGLAALAAVLLLVGLGFKVAFAPFHQWLPDVYTGSPTPVTAFMSVVVKTAAVGALLRVIASVILPQAGGQFGQPLMLSLAVLIGLTLVVGNLGALRQQGVKRLLAYSAVAHAGYVGLALLAGPDGMGAAAGYLLAYTVANVAAFAVLLRVVGDDDRGDQLARFAGLAKRRPFLAACMALAMFSLAGFPPTVGFVAKLSVFQAAIAAGWWPLALLGILTSVLAVVFYARVVLTMYQREPDGPAPLASRPAAGTVLTLALASSAVLLLGLFPAWWMGLIEQATRLW